MAFVERSSRWGGRRADTIRQYQGTNPKRDILPSSLASTPMSSSMDSSSSSRESRSFMSPSTSSGRSRRFFDMSTSHCIHCSESDQMRRSNPSSNVSESDRHFQYEHKQTAGEIRGWRTLLCLWDFIQVTTVHADIGTCDFESSLDKLSWPAWVSGCIKPNTIRNQPGRCGVAERSCRLNHR